MRAERSNTCAPSDVGDHPSCASRTGFEARHRPLRCIGDASFASALAADVALLLDVDPSVHRWRCRVAVGRDGLVADFETWGSGGQEFLFVAADSPPSCDPRALALPSSAKVVGPDDVDPIRLENARAIVPYARWRVTLDDRVRLLAALDEEGSVTLADCLGILRHTSRPVAAVAALALARVVDLDLDEPLGSRTRVIRRQA
ncbi:hypothetical protein [Aureimonas sp. AU22]|uniref:hypothetical protein n=1 Tax=Aureimonas sp. AU22 TaxID=1638162 RepID=UPI0007813FD8|nr:hypothetical protein [Aureimonas sp. AU22]